MLRTPFALLVYALLLTTGSAQSIQMPVLSNMIHEADQIYHVIIIERRGPVFFNEGEGEWTYKCNVKHSYKGKSKVGDIIYYHFTNRQNAKVKEMPRGEVGQQYILFLRAASESYYSVGLSPGPDGRSTTSAPVHLLVDQWLGILPWDSMLGSDVESLLRETKN